MASTQSQRKGGVDAQGNVRCGCGEITPRKVGGPLSSNPGRAYYTCVSFPPTKKCKYFVWEDDPVFQHSLPAHQTPTPAPTQPVQNTLPPRQIPRPSQQQRAIDARTPLPVTPQKRPRSPSPPRTPGASRIVYHRAQDGSGSGLDSLARRPLSSSLTPAQKKHRLETIQAGLASPAASQTDSFEVGAAPSESQVKDQNAIYDYELSGSQPSEQKVDMLGASQTLGSSYSPSPELVHVAVQADPIETSTESSDTASEALVKPDLSDEDYFFAPPADTDPEFPAARAFSPFRLPNLSQEPPHTPTRPSRAAYGSEHGLPTPPQSSHTVAEAGPYSKQDHPESPTRNKGKGRADGVNGPTWSRVQAEYEMPLRQHVATEAEGGTFVAPSSVSAIIEQTPGLPALANYILTLKQKVEKLERRNTALGKSLEARDGRVKELAAENELLKTQVEKLKEAISLL
ncbi:hypothetical protein OBBRIDRAFT_791441 [Obba rivulosa]|uniref:GRF-type domain-containing protein n=1 Tax=Obba rivulosa TaxID=1052685 RepID=A0A8E2B4J3_9APHY|nr:hypothetical protein OBBRIDRAFT_791441 [Obba rivulosa]